ncbi:MAG: hypothetical protein KI790_11705 [Cyclobacteriaceae bacterium]|nr:hypothetical protein [Cyclobacteriaceae bacterium HetDA_MAG_MS6]
MSPFLSIVFYLIILILNGVPLTIESVQDCKALLDGKFVNYSGDCRRGLAHGTGKAGDVICYEGQFKKGRPHGKGTYHWENGSFYKGNWVAGLKEGKGLLVMKRESEPDSVLSGYWKRDKYVGTGNEKKWEVRRNVMVRRYRFEKVSDEGDEVEIIINRNNTRFTSFSNLRLAGNGVEFRDALRMGFMSAHFPFEGNILMLAPNHFGVAPHDVSFEYVIYEPGKWILRIEV